MLAKIELGQQMAAEIAQIPSVFSKRVSRSVDLDGQFDDLQAIYTVARGSSDAAANILSYEWMRELQLPVTSLPPSVFSLGKGVRLDRSACLLVSQSGASEDLVKSALGARARGAHAAERVRRAMPRRVGRAGVQRVRCESRGERRRAGVRGGVRWGVQGVRG